MVLRRALLAASGSHQLRSFVSSTPVTRGVVERFVAGEDAEAAIGVVGRLARAGLLASIDRLGEDTTTPRQAEEVTRGYLHLIDRLTDHGLTAVAEVSVKPTAVGLALGATGESLATGNIARLCAAARRAGTTVTVDMEGVDTVAATLRVVARLRAEYPELGCVLQSYLRRTPEDLAAMAAPGARIRLCKGAYAPVASTAHTRRHDVDLAYARCLRDLIGSPAYPMIATHDPRLLEIAGELVRRAGRSPEDHEYQMLYGVRPKEQRRLAAAGARVRVYVPYGAEWYGYLVRRLAERPANLAFFARSLVSRG